MFNKTYLTRDINIYREYGRKAFLSGTYIKCSIETESGLDSMYWQMYYCRVKYAMCLYQKCTKEIYNFYITSNTTDANKE